MDLEFGKLQCGKKELLELVKALSRHKQNIIELSSSAGTLILRTGGAFYGTYLSPYDEVRVLIPYSGANSTCYSEASTLISDLKTKGAVVELRTKAKPLGWEDDFLSFKKISSIPMNPDELKNNLGFLLRLKQGNSEAKHQGVVFNGPEMLSTDCNSIHGATLSTPINSSPALCGRGAISSLYALLSTSTQWEIEGVFNPSHLKENKHDYGAFFFRLRDPSGIEVQLTSIPKTPANDMKNGTDGGRVRVPIDENAVSFSVGSSFLQEICSYAVKLEEGGTCLSLCPGEDDLIYEIWEGGKTPSANNKGGIPILWSGNRYATKISLDPERILLVLKKTTDEYVQFTVPYDPVDGFEFYQANPVYLNTNPNHFALIAPMMTSGNEEEINSLVAAKHQKYRDLEETNNV